MDYEKCRNCSAHVIPYIFSRDKFNHPLPYEECTPTCKCNKGYWDRPSDHQGVEGFCGYAYPDSCQGPEHDYIMNWNDEKHCKEIHFLN
jgi:hypothetical protein